MLARFFTYYKPHKRLFIIDFSSAVFVAILELLFPLAVQWFIDDLLPTNDWGMITKISALLLLTYIISTGMNFIVNYLGHKLGVNIETDMRQQLFNQVQRQPYTFFDNMKTGHLMSRITNDLFDIGEFAHHGPEDLFIAIMTFIGAFSIMYNINATMATIILIFVPFLIAVMYLSNKRMKKGWTVMYSEIANVNGRVEDSFSGIRVVKSFTNEDFEKKRFKEQNALFRKAKIYAYKVMAGTHSGIYILTRLLTLVVLVVGAWLVNNDQLSYGEFASFILFTNVLIKPIDKISALLEMYPKGMAGFKRFCDLIDQKPTITDRPDAIDVTHLNGDIAFNNVSFNYADSKQVLNNISFNVEAGKTIAFVGPSGSGKTTISALIPRFYDVTDGSITIDGHDIRDLTQESLRKQIGTVQQDVFLFTGTVRENIAYGKLGASFEAIQTAAAQANLLEFIENLPDGFETEIGERGLKLSGGQKQRLAIARMFLKNPPILILDEATSALDTATERVIQQSLNDLAKNRTTLIIAHRLATIRDADYIFVVTPNGIEEQGTYEELVAKGGIFAGLHHA